MVTIPLATIYIDINIMSFYSIGISDINSMSFFSIGISNINSMSFNSIGTCHFTLSVSLILIV